MLQWLERDKKKKGYVPPVLHMYEFFLVEKKMNAVDSNSVCKDADRCMLDVWKTAAFAYNGSSSYHTYDSVVIVTADSSFTLLNMVTLVCNDERTLSSLSKMMEAIERYKKSEKPKNPLVGVFPSYTLPDVFESVLNTCGWVVSPDYLIVMEYSGRSSEWDKVILNNNLHGLTFEHISTEAQYKTMMDVLCKVHHLAPGAGHEKLNDFGKSYYSISWDGNQTWFGFLAYLDKKPVAVATSIVLHKENSQYLFLVGVLPDYRRKGFGLAVTSHCMHTAYVATGVSRTLLHSTHMGYNLYCKLGFKPVGKVHVAYEKDA